MSPIPERDEVRKVLAVYRRDEKTLRFSLDGNVGQHYLEFAGLLARRERRIIPYTDLGVSAFWKEDKVTVFGGVEVDETCGFLEKLLPGCPYNLERYNAGSSLWEKYLGLWGLKGMKYTGQTFTLSPINGSNIEIFAGKTKYGKCLSTTLVDPPGGSFTSNLLEVVGSLMVLPDDLREEGKKRGILVGYKNWLNNLFVPYLVALPAKRVDLVKEAQDKLVPIYLQKELFRSNPLIDKIPPVAVVAWEPQLRLWR